MYATWRKFVVTDVVGGSGLLWNQNMLTNVTGPIPLGVAHPKPSTLASIKLEQVGTLFQNFYVYRDD